MNQFARIHHPDGIEQSILPLRNVDAIRSPAFGTTASQTGAIVEPITQIVILTESSIEKNLVRTLLADPAVATVRHQALKISYVDEHGECREHTVDFVATLRDGSKIGYVVKPEAHAVKHNTRGLVERLASCVHPKQLSRLQLVTSRNLPEWSNLNARQILGARRDKRTEVDDRLRGLAPELLKPIRIGDLTEMLGGGRVAFRPVLRAIHFGTLEYLGVGRIDQNALVRFSGQIKPDTDIGAGQPDIYADTPPIIRRRLKDPKPRRRASFRKV